MPDWHLWLALTVLIVGSIYVAIKYPPDPRYMGDDFYNWW